MKKVISAILLLLILANCSSCKKTETEKPDDEALSEDIPVLNEVEEKDNENEEEIPKAPETVYVPSDDNIVMKVGDKEITESMLRYYLLNYAKQYGGTNEKLWEDQAIKSIKKYVATEALADKLGVVPNDAQKEYYEYLIDYTVNKYNTTEGTSYEKAIADLYLTDALNRTMILSGLRANILYNEYITEGGKMYNATENDIVSYIKNNYIRIKHILIKTVDLDDSQKAEARKRAEKICDEAMSGANFEGLVMQYSEDTMDVETGYYFTRGEKIQALENKAFELKVGEVSDIVESAYGYHIIKKYEHDRDYILSDATLRKTALSHICEKAYDTDIEIVAQGIRVQYLGGYKEAKDRILAER
jgi:foldase protein PrsA